MRLDGDQADSSHCGYVGTIMRYFVLNGSEMLGTAIAKAGGFAVDPHEEREFEFGEHKSRSLVSVRGEDVYVFHAAHGGNTNMVESYFSRLRRMVNGQHHGVSPKYLHQYSAHAAWLEDHRRRSNGENAFATVADTMAHPVSRNWKGYWQRSA